MSARRLRNSTNSGGRQTFQQGGDSRGCLTQAQLKQFHLPEEPLRWCITGAGLEAERDPKKWQPLWPYHTAAWRDWLAAPDRGESPASPEEE